MDLERLAEASALLSASASKLLEIELKERRIAALPAAVCKETDRAHLLALLGAAYQETVGHLLAAFQDLLAALHPHDDQELN